MRIAIASGKGGTGKTTLSTNLASYMAEREDVVLVDLDVEEPNSALFLDAKELSKEDKFKMIPKVDKSICNVCGDCQDYCKFNSLLALGDELMIFPELCHSCYACVDLCKVGALKMTPTKMGVLKHFSKERLSFIESRLDIGQEMAVPLISQTISYVEKHFPKDTIAIFDCPPGTSCPVIEATKDADFVILVTEPTPFGLHDLTIAVETMRALNMDFGVLVNRYGIGNDDVIDYCDRENITVLAKIANDRRVAELYSKGSLLYPYIDDVKTQLDSMLASIYKMKGIKE